MIGADVYPYACSNEPLEEVARIFALGILRLDEGWRSDGDAASDFSKTALKTARKDLEQSRDLRLSVTRG